MRCAGALAVLGATVVGSPATRTQQDPQAEFARAALAAIAAQDDEGLGALVSELPWRARLLAHELLWEARRSGSLGERPLEAARRLARVVGTDPLDPADAALGAAVGRVEGMDEDERTRQRELDRAFFAATAALGRDQREAARVDAGRAAELAAELELPYLEMRARRLHAETLRDQPGFRGELLRVLEIERALGLWAEEGADLATLAEVEVLEGRLLEAAEHLEGAERLARRTDAPERASELAALRGGVLANLGRFDGAHELLTVALADLEARGLATEAARASTLLGELAGGAGRYEEALARFSEAGRAARAAGDAPGEARARIRLAGTYSELGLVADAEDALERARAVVHEHELEPELRQWNLVCGLVQLDAGRAREALDTLGAIEGPEGSAPDALFAEARRLLGAVHLSLGEARAAEDAFRAALAAWSADPLKNTWARTGLADALLLQGKMQAAEDEYGRALADAEGVASLEGSWRARLGLGRCAEADGRNGEALTHVLGAIADIEGLRSLLAAPSLRTRWLGNKLEPYHRGARLLARAGRLEEAYRLAESAKARTLLELAARPLASSDDEPAGPERSARSSVRARLADAESRTRLCELQLGALPPSEASAASRDELAARLREARAEHEAARIELELADPRAAMLLGLAEAPSLGETRAALRAGECLLHYSIGGEGAGLFVVSPRGARFVELATNEAELDALVRRILDPIEHLCDGRLDLANLGFDARAAQALFSLLVEPARAELAGCRTVWVVPDGVLRRVPFALLVSAREKRPVDPGRLFAQYEGCRFLIEDLAVASLPSAGLLRVPPRLSDAARECLVVADPRPRPPDAVELASSVAEARAIAAGTTAPARLLLGTEASEARVKSALPLARFVHLATHGFLDDRRPAFSRLALAPGDGEDGWLHAHEIETLPLCAERVVLSACETLGEAGRGEGWLGLARAFLQAGARSVVATAWAVDDRATEELMRRYQEALARGDEPVAALRTAQVALLRERGRPGLLYLHPYFWGSFQHVGPR